MVKNLKCKLEEFHLLKHPFYQNWSKGSLPVTLMQEYACLYYQHVNAFPRYISSIHSLCEDIKARQVLLENLIDEEQGEENHPELWLRFCDSLAIKRKQVENHLNSAVKKLVDGFFTMCRSSYAEGMGALFAYEQQVPSVAQSKIDGLRRFYGYSDHNPGLQFFKVHIHADKWHAEQCAGLINELDNTGQETAAKAAVKAARLLWELLDSIYYKGCAVQN